MEEASFQIKTQLGWVPSSSGNKGTGWILAPGGPSPRVVREQAQSRVHMPLRLISRVAVISPCFCGVYGG